MGGENSDALLFEKRGQVALLTLSRPEKLNALSAGLRDASLEALDAVRNDDDIRVAIITGAGRGFCSGADLTGGAERAAPSQNSLLDDYGCKTKDLELAKSSYRQWQKANSEAAKPRWFSTGPSACRTMIREGSWGFRARDWVMVASSPTSTS